MDNFSQVLLLLGITVSIVVFFARFHIPSSLGYLLVGFILGPHTMGPIIHLPHITALAEFGIVFLLFTIGLNFSLPQIYALRHRVFSLGTGQVVLTTITVGLLAWAVGLSATAAFVVGAVFAQSSTTIIGKQLAEQGEENSRHGKLGLAMSVFQDVTAVPFVVIIPVLGMAVGADLIFNSLIAALAKALLAFCLVFFIGRWLLGPLFHFVAQRRSAEVFTLTVLLVALLAAWTTESFGLSLAFGAFLAGMVLGETQFRHQVESTIRPFRDVLLGLFFIGIGMLLDPSGFLSIWHWAIVGTLVLLISKTLLVMMLMKTTGSDWLTAWRTGLLLAVGGEFGFAVLAIALSADVIDVFLGQIVLASVLFSMIAGPFIIRYNKVIARCFVREHQPSAQHTATQQNLTVASPMSMQDHVIIFGYGRIGQSVAYLLSEEKIPYLALDLDSSRVRQAHTAGKPVYYGDATDRSLLDLLNLNQARLVIISHDNVAASLKTLEYLQTIRSDLPVMVRTRDESCIDELKKAGATEVVPETLEAALMTATQSLLLLGVPSSKIFQYVEDQRTEKYQLIREFFQGSLFSNEMGTYNKENLHLIQIKPPCNLIGHSLSSIRLDIEILSIIRQDTQLIEPSFDTIIEANDTLVVHASSMTLLRAKDILYG